MERVSIDKEIRHIASSSRGSRTQIAQRANLTQQEEKDIRVSVNSNQQVKDKTLLKLLRSIIFADSPDDREIFLVDGFPQSHAQLLNFLDQCRGNEKWDYKVKGKALVVVIENDPKFRQSLFAARKAEEKLYWSEKMYRQLCKDYDNSIDELLEHARKQGIPVETIEDAGNEGTKMKEGTVMEQKAKDAIDKVVESQGWKDVLSQNETLFSSFHLIAGPPAGGCSSFISTLSIYFPLSKQQAQINSYLLSKSPFPLFFRLTTNGSVPPYSITTSSLGNVFLGHNAILPSAAANIRRILHSQEFLAAQWVILATNFAKASPFLEGRSVHQKLLEMDSSTYDFVKGAGPPWRNIHCIFLTNVGG
ncbi:hypothetical protein P154DRAFT_536791 [Amniculicola lignicola CBS 123094]|uniref:Uncharacterized protein n=1 Tax=Amniculicola lignicola CBS 123094 TaxID=1392246 RepID=A0A6A5WJT6_9PLEO|nr:hypothetical protein P154DRAFT_536791 [Amniculicola lignicola CBS 123094]